MVTRKRAEKRVPRDASRFRFGIVVSDYHPQVAGRLLKGALECLALHQVKPSAVRVFRVPGAFEIPQATSRLLRRSGHGFDAMICLGLLMRGETLHFEILSRAVCASLSRTALRTGVPVAFGVLTVENARQARERSGKGSSNKGWEAARAAIRMAALYQSMEARD